MAPTVFRMPVRNCAICRVCKLTDADAVPWSSITEQLLTAAGAEAEKCAVQGCVGGTGCVSVGVCRAFDAAVRDKPFSLKDRAVAELGGS